MNRSPLTRIGGWLAAAALSVTTLGVVGAAPANADSSTCTTKTTITANGTTKRKQVSEWGDFGSLRAEVDIVTCSGGTAATYIGSGAGTVRIERSTNGGRTWSTVKDNGYTDWASHYGENVFRATALYRAVYTGGTESTTYQPDSFHGSVSAPVLVNVIRDVNFTYKSRRGAIDAKFKITPKTGLVGKKLKVQVKRGGWKAYKRAKVNNKGVLSVRLKGGRKTTVYRVVLPRGNGFSASWSGVRVY